MKSGLSGLPCALFRPNWAKQAWGGGAQYAHGYWNFVCVTQIKPLTGKTWIT